MNFIIKVQFLRNDNYIWFPSIFEDNGFRSFTVTKS